MTESFSTILDTFTRTIHKKNVSWVSGSTAVTNDMTTLYVKDTDDNCKAIIKFPFPSNEKLVHLYKDAAEPAYFGKGNQTVLDPSYRSASTILSDDFAINLRPDATLRLSQ